MSFHPANERKMKNPRRHMHRCVKAWAEGNADLARQLHEAIDAYPADRFQGRGGLSFLVHAVARYKETGRVRPP